MNLQIQPLRALSEMRAVVQLQKTYWGESVQSLVPEHMLFSIAAHGGHVLAATDGDILVGVVIGLLGTSMTHTDQPAAENLHVFSKRMIVRRDYRGHGIGARLKFAQREHALQQGVTKIVWTFDPFLAPNAHLNLRKLGGISRSYRENYYGTDNTGGLSPDGTSDRLYLEWLLTEASVENRITGQWDALTLADYVASGAKILNPAVLDEIGYLHPTVDVNDPKTDYVLIEIPANYYDLAIALPDVGLLWREQARGVLGGAVRSGYVIQDFVSVEENGIRRSYYVLHNRKV